VKSNTFIAPNLITTAENQRAMIFFFFLKSKYRKSVFYHYKPERLADFTGISVNTIRKYISWLKINGYLAKKDGNLWLKSTRKISDREKQIRVDSKPWTTWEQFENRTYAAIIKHNLKQQAFHYEMKGLTAGTFKKKNSVRILKRYLKKYSEDTKESAIRPVNSVRQISRLFNRSKSWAQRKLIQLQKMGYVKLDQQIESLNGYVPPQYCENGFAYYNKRRKATCIHHGTKITVIY